MKTGIQWTGRGFNWWSLWAFLWTAGPTKFGNFWPKWPAQVRTHEQTIILARTPLCILKLRNLLQIC